MNRLTVLLLILLLQACAEVREYVQGDLRKPAELTRIEPTLEVALDWSVQLEAMPEVHDYHLRPVVRDGVVYVAESRGRIAAYDTAKGNLIWDKVLDVVFSGGVSVDQGMVVINTRNAEVIALSTTDGQEKWRATVSSESLRPAVITASIVVVHTSDDKLIGIDSKDGTRVWVAGYSYPSLSLRGTSAPLVWNGVVISGLANGKIVAVDLNNGKKMWETSLAVASGRTELERLVDLDGGAVIQDNLLYVPSYQGRVAALNLENGQILWAREMSSFSNISLHGNVLYMNDEFSQVWALDRLTGTPMWRQDQLHGRMLTSPVLQNGYLIVGDFEGYLHWLSAKDGSFLARVRLDQAQNQARALGQVHVPEEELYGYIVTDYGIVAEPFIEDKRIYVVDRSGVLAAYHLTANN